jgi:multidrug efflux pump subunit AcrA (membrane-fusion protein)
VIASFANADNSLRPGMFATAELLLPEREQAVYIPRDALMEEPETASWQVYAIENGRARLRVVQTGEVEGGYIRILSGVNPGETVAVGNLGELFDGARVEVRGGA